jgi:hypothetical protein
MTGQVGAPADGVTVALPRAASVCVGLRQILAMLTCLSVLFAYVVQVRAAATPRPLQSLVVGAWIFVSSTNTRRDGSTFDRWGANPSGMMIFDDAGHYSQMITSNDRFFGAKTVASFGHYRIDDKARILSIIIDASTSPKAVGTTQRRQIVVLTEDDFRYINPDTTSGNIANVLWKRAK